MDETDEIDYPSAYDSKRRIFSMEKTPSVSRYKRKATVDLRSNEETKISATFQSQRSKNFYLKNDLDEKLLPISFGNKKSAHSTIKVEKRSGFGDGFDQMKPFSITLPLTRKSMCEKREDEEVEIEKNVIKSKLRSGMVLLENYLSLNQQVEIVKTCDRLGKRRGGFYQPGYHGGAKLRLQMMCLGRNWDPQTKYDEFHRRDGSEAPPIPDELVSLVENAIKDSHGVIDFEDELPAMSPDVCIVNFYTTSGRLGLHQDRDESSESLDRGLPVVSFSIGDVAEFLYGDNRDLDKAEKILLKSGDVLIFGGKSRLVFHGVKSVIPNSAPRSLLNETRLCPGRLNLTFRQF